MFLIYINDISNSLIYGNAFIFADDTALLYAEENQKRIQKRINIDLKLLLKWLKANKISLNVKKTEAVVFKTPNKKLDYNLKIKLDGKRLPLSSSVRYLGVIIDEHLCWTKHLDLLASKLRRANGMLSNLRHYLPKYLLRSIYFALFHSHLAYSIEIWGQGLPRNNRIEILQKTAVRILTFSKYNEHSDRLFKHLEIPTLRVLLLTKNILLAHQSLNNIAPKAVRDTLNLRFTSNPFNTRGVSNKLLARPFIRTTKFGIKSIKYQLVINWNEIQNKFKDIDLTSSVPSKIIKLINIVK